MATIELCPKRHLSRKASPADTAAVLVAPVSREVSSTSQTGDEGGELLSVARCLYYAMLDLLAGSDDPGRDSHRLTDPLRRVVGEDRTLAGQADCARIAAALVSDDPNAALDACRHAVRRASLAARE